MLRQPLPAQLSVRGSAPAAPGPARPPCPSGPSTKPCRPRARPPPLLLKRARRRRQQPRSTRAAAATPAAAAKAARAAPRASTHARRRGARGGEARRESGAHARSPRGAAQPASATAAPADARDGVAILVWEHTRGSALTRQRARGAPFGQPFALAPPPWCVASASGGYNQRVCGSATPARRPQHRSRASRPFARCAPHVAAP